MDVSVATELDPDDLPDEYKTCIYRVVQEALHNCARHSRTRPQSGYGSRATARID